MTSSSPHGGNTSTSSPPPKRRILCIDGGGIRGTFPAAFLSCVEEHLQYPIGSYFDLIAGTSTGGIIALGLGMGLRASDICSLYEKSGPEIFAQHHGTIQNIFLRHLRAARWLYREKYTSDKLKEALIKVLGDRRLGHSSRRLVIPSWNPTARSVYLYKTAHHERLRTDYKVSAVDVALATSAAPTYFKEHIAAHDVGLVDGGVWANNPIALAVVEAMTILSWPADSLHVLSLGCTQAAYSLPRSAGIGTLATKTVTLFMDGQSHSAYGMAKLLTGHENVRTAIHRIDHNAPPDAYNMDDTRRIRELKGLGYHYARDRFPALKEIFF